MVMVKGCRVDVERVAIALADVSDFLDRDFKATEDYHSRMPHKSIDRLFQQHAQQKAQIEQEQGLDRIAVIGDGHYEVIELKKRKDLKSTRKFLRHCLGRVKNIEEYLAALNKGHIQLYAVRMVAGDKTHMLTIEYTPKANTFTQIRGYSNSNVSDLVPMRRYGIEAVAVIADAKKLKDYFIPGIYSKAGEVLTKDGRSHLPADFVRECKTNPALKEQCFLKPTIEVNPGIGISLEDLEWFLREIPMASVDMTHASPEQCDAVTAINGPLKDMHGELKNGKRKTYKRLTHVRGNCTITNCIPPNLEEVKGLYTLYLYGDVPHTIWISKLKKAGSLYISDGSIGGPGNPFTRIHKPKKPVVVVLRSLEECSDINLMWLKHVRVLYTPKMSGAKIRVASEVTGKVHRYKEGTSLDDISRYIRARRTRLIVIEKK
jgi:hypothetical protein